MSSKEICRSTDLNVIPDEVWIDEIIRFCDLDTVCELMYVNKKLNFILSKELPYKLLCKDLYGSSFTTDYFKKEYERGYKEMYFTGHHNRFNHYCFINNRNPIGESLFCGTNDDAKFYFEEYQNFVEKYPRFDFPKMINEMMDSGKVSVAERFQYFESSERKNEVENIGGLELFFEELEIGILAPYGESFDEILKGTDIYVFVFHWPGGNQMGEIFRCSQKDCDEDALLPFKNVLSICDSNIEIIKNKIDESNYEEDFEIMNKFFLQYGGGSFVKYKDMVDKVDKVEKEEEY